MTKETKIGLLVGLAFIILFAIILSGNGSTRGTSSPNAISVADAGGAKDPSTGAEKPLHNEGRLPVEAQLPPVVQGSPSVPANVFPPKEKPVEGRTTSDGGLGTAVPSSVVEYLNQPVDGNDEDPDARPRRGETEETVPLRDAVASALEETEKVLVKTNGQGQAGEPTKAPGASGTKDRGATSSDATVAAKTDATKPSGETSAARKPEGEPPVVKTVHAVQPGESLGKIAAKYYGRSTPERVEAIFNANRDVLKDKQKVKANDKLKIPALEGHEREFEAAPEFPAANMKSPHEIQKDGLARIPQPVGETPKTSNRPPANTGAETSVVASALNRGVPVGPGASATSLKLVETPAKATTEMKPGTPASPSETGAPKVRWYEVKKSDTLSTIAQRELGSSRRYQEIYELNKNVIRDRDRLKAGAKIRLPERTASSASPALSEPGKTTPSTAQLSPAESRRGRPS
jgi:nucleoid-associated protein YgaU